MTNREKLRSIFPNTIFLYQKDITNRTIAIICSDEWLDADYDEQKEKGEEIRRKAKEIMRHIRPIEQDMKEDADV